MPLFPSKNVKTACEITEKLVSFDEKFNKRIQASNRNIAKHLGITVNTVKRVRKFSILNSKMAIKV